MKAKDVKRLQEAIAGNKESVQEDIKEKSFSIGCLLSKQSTIAQRINTEATLLEVYKNRAEALKTITPETFVTDYIDKYFYDWPNVEYTKEMLNIDMVLGYLYEKLSLQKYLVIRAILKQEGKE